ncbi:MAG: discoidin domain-containing protein [Oscillospiraceae bacterium]
MMKKVNNLQRKLQSMLALLLAIGLLLGGTTGFSAAAPDASVTPLVNVALHKPAYTDKVLSYKVPALAVDGDTSSASYCDMGNALPASLTVDLLAEYEIEQIHVTPYFDGGRGYSYDVYASTDNQTFTRICGKQDVSPQSETGDDYQIDPTKARYLKVTLTGLSDPDNAANQNARITEFAAYAKADREPSPMVSQGASVTSANGVPARVIDNDFSNYWDGGKAPSSFVMDLGAWYDIDQIDLWPYFASSGRIYHYTVSAARTRCNTKRLSAKRTTNSPPHRRYHTLDAPFWRGIRKWK